MSRILFALLLLATAGPVNALYSRTQPAFANSVPLSFGESALSRFGDASISKFPGAHCHRLHQKYGFPRDRRQTSGLRYTHAALSLTPFLVAKHAVDTHHVLATPTLALWRNEVWVLTSCIIMLGIIYEKLEHRVMHSTPKSFKPAISAMFNEFGALGFISMVVFLITHPAHGADAAFKVLRDPTPAPAPRTTTPPRPAKPSPPPPVRGTRRSCSSARWRRRWDRTRTTWCTTLSCCTSPSSSSSTCTSRRCPSARRRARARARPRPPCPPAPAHARAAALPRHPNPMPPPAPFFDKGKLQGGGRGGEKGVGSARPSRAGIRIVGRVWGWGGVEWGGVGWGGVGWGWGVGGLGGWVKGPARSARPRARRGSAATAPRPAIRDAPCTAYRRARRRTDVARRPAGHASGTRRSRAGHAPVTRRSCVGHAQVTSRRSRGQALLVRRGVGPRAGHELVTVPDHGHGSGHEPVTAITWSVSGSRWCLSRCRSRVDHVPVTRR
jgi:hypothetical protein